MNDPDPLLDQAVKDYVVPVPDGFADRVLAEHALAEHARRRPLRASNLWVAVAAAVVLAAGSYAYANREVTGALIVQERTSRDIGPLTLVAESGAELSWTVRGDDAVIEHGAGDVFYRVERGTTIEVRVPGGTVRVLGTCFAIKLGEESMGRIPNRVIGAVVGVVATVVVYEGRVVLANDAGEVELAAGETGVLPNQVPEPRSPQSLPSAEEAEAQSAGTLSDDNDNIVAGENYDGVTRDELLSELARLRAHEQRLVSETQALRSRLDDDGEESSGRHTSYYPASRSEYAELADRCAIRMDLPPVFSTEPPDVDDDAFPFQEGEQAIVREVLRRQHRSLRESLRELYVEATGDEAGADVLSARSMLDEIVDKAPHEYGRNVYRHISQERANRAQAPDTAEQSATERAVRLMAETPDDLQRRLAESLGAERANELRAAGGGWPWGRHEYSGCGE